jgi:hypothetical protein
MRSRFFMTLALAAGAGFLVVETQGFSPGPAAWIGFGVGSALTVMCAALLIESGRRHYGPAWLAIPALGLVIAGWDVVSSLVFADPTAKWLVFANGCGLVAMALAGLIVHELSTERVVHSLEIGEGALGERTERRERVGA